MNLYLSLIQEALKETIRYISVNSKLCHENDVQTITIFYVVSSILINFYHLVFNILLSTVKFALEEDK